MNAIIGKKIDQRQAFLSDGSRIPVTVIDVWDNAVLSVKTLEKNGYTAIQLGYGSRKKSGKTLLGHAKKANLTAAPLLIREVRVQEGDSLPATGDRISPESVLKPGDIVKVTGVSKGKGFAGVVKRHHFRGGPRTHGQSDRERAPGSIGQTTTPGRVYRGKKMAGRMGHKLSAVLNLQIIDIDIKDQTKTVLVKGLVPGSVNSLVMLEKTGELPEKKIILLSQKEDDIETKVLTEATTGEQQVDEQPVAQAAEGQESLKTETIQEEEAAVKAEDK